LYNNGKGKYEGEKCVMSIESDLRKDGIEVIAPIPTLTINSLAKAVSEKLCFAFPELNLNGQDLFIELSRLSMYTASMPQGMAEANYFYKNSSVYFRENVDLSHVQAPVVHELIHHLQALRDKDGELIRLGFCEFGEFKTYGVGLNEGAVQLMASHCMQEQSDIVKYYELSFPTSSQTYYPLLCNLVAQMAYITGTEYLYKSAFFSTDDFKNRFIELCGEKAFYQAVRNLDTLFYTEEKIIQLQNAFLTEKSSQKTQRIATKIVDLKDKIKETFLQTQNLLFTSYFNTEFKKLTTTEDIEAYRTQLYNYQNYIAITEGYTAFHVYYINQMANLEAKHESILNNTALVLVQPNKFIRFLQALRKLWTKQTSSTVELNEWK